MSENQNEKSHKGRIIFIVVILVLALAALCTLAYLAVQMLTGDAGTTSFIDGVKDEAASGLILMSAGA